MSRTRLNYTPHPVQRRCLAVHVVHVSGLLKHMHQAIRHLYFRLISMKTYPKTCKISPIVFHITNHGKTDVSFCVGDGLVEKLMQLGRCNGLRFRAGDNQGSKIIEDRVQHLGAKGCFFGIINQLFNDGNPFQWCIQTLWETALRVFWSSIGVSSRNVQHCLQKVRWTDLEEPRESSSSCGHSSKGYS